MSVEAVLEIEPVSDPETVRAEVEAAAGSFEPAWHTRLNHTDTPAWFLARSGGRLIGFLTVFAPSPDAAEVSCYVVPEFRKQGVFRSLLTRARAVWGQRRWLLVIDRNHPADAVKKLGRLAFTESTLALPVSSRPEFWGLPDGLSLSEAQASDLTEAAGVLDRANDETGHLEFVKKVFAEPSRRLIVLRDGERIVGVGGLEPGDETGLFALAIDPEHQGKGWGRLLVTGLLELGKAGSRGYVIDVDSTNARAEHLYRSVGFTDRRVTDYYELVED